MTRPPWPDVTAPVRIGPVSYLNTRPLVHGLMNGMGRERVTLHEDIPSSLADRLARGDLDVALLPAIELARIPDLTVTPGLAIGSLGRCLSVLLIARKPLDEVRSVALDPESRTSNALTRVLFEEHWGGSPTFTPGTGDLETDLAVHEAAVRIGDKALFLPVPEGATAHDLGEAWTEHTGLPFVFAVWAARPGILDRPLYELLHASKRAGDRALIEVARTYEWRGETHPDLSYDYLSRHMRYRLGGPEVAGLTRFLHSAAAHGIAPDATITLATFGPTACRPVGGAA